jgi:hypothetical protein
VERFYAAGATDNGPLAERAYHPGYYAAYALHPGRRSGVTPSG